MTQLLNNLIASVLNAFRQPISPERLAISITIGVITGIFPLPGTTTLLCLALCFVCKLNVPSASIFNLIMTPLDFLLFIPFIALGDRILRSKALPESPSLLIDGLKRNFFETLINSAAALFHGIFAWFVVSIPLTFILYRFILWGLRKRNARVAPQHVD